MKALDEITEVLHAVNSAWQNPDEKPIGKRIRKYFAKDAVIVGPSLERVARGRKAVTESYDAFVRGARILHAALGAPEIDIGRDVAVATLEWEMTYEFQESETTERGHDVYVLRRQRGRWLIWWRQIVAFPGS
ncbi:MAG: nuclear transport factor 2 family protein [Candidatus Eremiobacteraeota bacterium]|nr:nuclear transport factor 2 family protein [Candidatus Eremiobacteraeota bacterium]